MYSPRWLFLYPGALLISAGLLGYALALPGISALGVTFDAHTLLFSSLFVVLGYQSILFAVFAKTFAISDGLLPEKPRMTRFSRIVSLEKALIAGVGALALGLALLAAPGITLTALGYETVLSGFLLSILRMRRR
jgi:hypothetical protein